MTPADLASRNTEKLAECYSAFAAPLTRVLDAMRRAGFRPRIQEAWRSEAAQLAAYQRGTSHLRYGLHNATGRDGTREALAADVLDDDHPTGPPLRYLLALAVAADAAGLETGILWGLSDADAQRTQRAVDQRNVDAQVRVGWDPTHVQARGLTGSQVRAGARPATNEEDDVAITADDLTAIRAAIGEEIDERLHAVFTGRGQTSAADSFERLYQDGVATHNLVEKIAAKVAALTPVGGVVDVAALARELTPLLAADLAARLST